MEGRGLTCLVGVRLARALKLVVSVMSMVCGSRPVWVYWPPQACDCRGLARREEKGGYRHGTWVRLGSSHEGPQGRGVGLVSPAVGQWSGTQG